MKHKQIMTIIQMCDMVFSTLKELEKKEAFIKMLSDGEWPDIANLYKFHLENDKVL